jgi:hypothetical protein
MYFDIKSEAMIRMKVSSGYSPARALISRVFPVPGACKNKILI